LEYEVANREEDCSLIRILHPKYSRYFFEIEETLKRLNMEFTSLGFDPVAGISGIYEKLEREPENLSVLPTGQPAIRSLIAEYVQSRASTILVGAIDPTSVVSTSSTLGCGVYVNANSTIASNAEIGCIASVNRSSSIGHDVVVEPFVSVGPGVTLAGSVHVELGTVLGAGVVVLPNIVIGRNSLIGAGSVVTRDIPANSVAFGNPARVMRKQEEWSGLEACPFC
jgi:sugar O-acyltransferase (sialic acid O-acetyltransferase NeuD family)